MSNVQRILNINEKQDEKIESIEREIADYEKELSFLRIKNESNPGKKFFWKVLEVIGWIFISLSSILILASLGTKEDNVIGVIMLFIIEIPSLLLTLLFRHFKSMYEVKEENIEKLKYKILNLKKELETFNEEKRNIINLASNDEILNINQSFNDEKECPMCAEMVKAKAKICRFCGYTFNQDDSV